uniref:Uncharacterized protein n=1 Tax=Hyaloperonospora arabidopsidis (strain Emoy2) TaxID=559515 RepID=M4BJT6_HYAAE
MTVSKPSKKQRGKLKPPKTKKEPAKTHVKFDENGEKIVPKKRARVITKKEAGETNEGGGKSDRSPDAIQQAKYYLEQWQKRDELKSNDELPWKFKTLYPSPCLLLCCSIWTESKALHARFAALTVCGRWTASDNLVQRVADKAQSVIDIGVPSKDEENAAAGEQEKMLSIKLARRRYKRALQVAELLA